MAQPSEARTGEKRGPGRPPKSATPALKKVRTSFAGPTTPADASPSTRSPAVGSPGPERRNSRLPVKVADNKPLPNLPAPQPSSLSNDDYHTIAASAVLAASIERSRLNWACNGLFKKYWTKPESGKNAKPPPPGNPDAKSMKGKGECRLRIEPHIFEAEVYVVEERPKLPTAPKQYTPTPTQSPYGVVPRPPQNQQILPNRPPSTNGHTPLQPAQRSSTPIQPHPAAQPRAQAASGTLGAQQEKKPADPVISMLAARASSDVELKALMKEVATGKATPDQLKIFQRHIDELTGIIQKQKVDDDDHRTNGAQQSEAIQYDGPAESKPQPPPPPLQAAAHPQQQVQPRPSSSTPQPPPPYNQQPTWTTPSHVPTTFPVVLDFSKKTPGATEDRFLFPQHSVLEALSPQHLLVSFMVTRYGRDAADPTGLEPDRQYWQPVTMMVEVAYTREEILNCIRRWVKPLEEVRKYMEETMKNCTRAPETHLAMRLPVKGVAPEIEEAPKEATPLVEEKEKPSRPKSTVKYVKRASTSKASPNPPKKTAEPVKEQSNGTAPSPAPAPPSTEKRDNTPKPATDGAADAPDSSEAGRPRRTVRKSVRISEG